jgi:hypothetical protein
MNGKQVYKNSILTKRGVRQNKKRKRNNNNMTGENKKKAICIFAITITPNSNFPL